MVNRDNHGTGDAANRHSGLQNTTEVHPLHVSVMSLEKEIEDFEEYCLFPLPNSDLAQDVHLISAGTWYKISFCYRLFVTE